MKKVQLLLSTFILGAASVFGQLTPQDTPDAYGYVWRDTTNVNGPDYQWIDISTVGTNVTSGLADDNIIGPINMGMTFKHYWNTYDKIYIGSNGYVSFANASIGSGSTGFPGMPSANNLNDIIAPMMADFIFNNNGANLGKVFTYHDVAANLYIITFDQVAFWQTAAPNYSGANTFQIVLDGNDNSITFNYKEQLGDWNASYNQLANPMVSGIENSTGQYGIFVENKIKPTDSTAVKFYAPTTAGVNVTDAAPTSVQNAVSGGFFIKPKQLVNLNSTISNTGNVDITGTINVSCKVKTRNNAQMHLETTSIPGGLTTGASQNITFADPFYTDSVGSYNVEIKSTLTGDMNAGNNTKFAEMVAIGKNPNNPNEEILSFVTHNLPNSSINWGDINSGGGVYFVPYEYPTIIRAIEVMVFPTIAGGTGYTPAPNSPAYMLQLFDDSGVNGTIGQVLANDTIKGADVTFGNPTGPGMPFNWSRHDFANPIIITGNPGNTGVYAGWIQQNDTIVLASEDTLTSIISNRTYEILGNTWAVYRNSSREDLYIRLITDTTSAPVVSGVTAPKTLSGLEVFPNPSHGVFTVNMKFETAQNLSIKVLDLAGRKVYLDFQNNQMALNKELNLSHLAKGVYLVQIETESGVATQKVVID